MARDGGKWLFVAVTVAAFGLLMAVTLGSAQRTFLRGDSVSTESPEEKTVDPVEGGPFKHHVLKSSIGKFLWRPTVLSYHHVWPGMRFGWRIIVGTVVGFFGAAVGSVGGVGGGGIFVPMLTLIIGFDAKSSTAISKCMIMGAAGSTVYFNLKLKHPTLDLPIIDYDLAMLFQPMLMLGISIGVACNVIFANWMVTVLLIILFIGTSTKAFFKGVETWKQETLRKKEVEREHLENVPTIVEPEVHQEVDFKSLPSEPEQNRESNGNHVEGNGNNEASTNERLPTDATNTIWLNVRWKELGILVLVWVAILALQILKNYTTTCSIKFWVLNLLQIPIAFSVSIYEAVALYRGTARVTSKGEGSVDWKISQLLLFLFAGIMAGLVGGLLGLGGGFILGPLFLELGVPPQVSSATATFVMLFSSSMSVVEYYFLKRFPVPYAAYFFGVCIIAAFMGQHVIRKLVLLLGRASIIIFCLAFMIFISAWIMGGVGISKMVHEIKDGAYMGFQNLCSY
jgi:uncharacterized membrane protein YfcA